MLVGGLLSERQAVPEIPNRNPGFCNTLFVRSSGRLVDLIGLNLKI